MLSTLIFVPIDATMKKPIVTAQHEKTGHVGSRRFKDSAVAQQLIPPKIKNAKIQTNFK